MTRRTQMDGRGAEDRWTARGGWLTGSLGRQLIGWFLIFSLVPLFASNTLGYLRSKDILADLTRRYLEALAEVGAKHVRGQVERYVLDLEAITAGNEFLVAGALRLSGEPPGPMGEVADKVAVERHLERKLAELSVFQNLYVQASDGRLLASTGPLPDAATYGGPLATASVTPGLSQVKTGGPPLFRLAAAVKAEGGRVVAYLCGLVGPPGLGPLLEIPEHLAGSVESYIVDQDGRPLFVSHAHGPVDYSAPISSPVLHPGADTFSEYEDHEGVPVIGASVQIEDLPWRYLAEAPVSTALDPLQRLRRTSLVVELLMAVLLATLAWLVARGIVAPVHRLVAATRRVGGGELDVSVEATERSEIGELGRAFNEMTAELGRTQERVRELHRREMERADQLATVGELASGVAHEIKNPVVGIAGGLDLVRRRVGEDDTLDPIMDEMERQLTRIESAVRDLLAFSRPTEPTLAPTDAAQVAERAVRLVQPAAQRQDVELLCRTDGEVCDVSMDEELVRQAVVNLIMNAVHATPAGGRVTVTTRGGDGGVEFEVRDTGKGITPDETSNIFKPFFTTRHSGTGLGLPISKEIVERHGGRLEVESRVGEGSTFTVFLPFEPTTPVDDPAAEEAIESDDGERGASE